jgi:hypothetical protein
MNGSYTKDMEVDDTELNLGQYQKEGLLAEDIKMGWKPAYPANVTSIPLYYDFNQYQFVDLNQLVYYGKRIKNSIRVHQEYSKQQRLDGIPSY